MDFRRIELDPYASVFVDAIKYRQDAANKSIALGKAELEICEGMKNKILTYLMRVNQVDGENSSVSLDVFEKVFIVGPKPQAEKSQLPSEVQEFPE